MLYNEIWAGVFCVKCHQPILALREESWGRFVAQKSGSALQEIRHRLSCCSSACLSTADYLPEEFVRFRVEELAGVPKLVDRLTRE
jgi:hypothetical protein